MRLEENHENWLKFANDYWEIDNGLSAVELGKDMIMKHVRRARDSAYGYTGYLDETIARTDKVIDSVERDNLKDTVDSLCDLGEIDAVTKALKNVVLSAVQRNTGVKPQPFLGGGMKIAVGVNKSPVRYNGMAVKRSPVKSYNDVVNAPQKAFNPVVSDSLNLSARTKSILEEAIARKAAEAGGRLVNPTNAASTINIPTNRQPNQEKNAVAKFTDDDEAIEGTWSTHMKKEAISGRMKFDTAAGKTVEMPVVRMASFDDTRARLPFEFRGVNPSDAATRLSQGVVDVVNPNGSAHGPINFNTDGTKPAIAGQTKDAVFPNAKSKFPNKEKDWEVNLKKPKQPVQNQNPQGNPYTGAI
jgi:hypothetical protein